ncbi:hypothetical protein CRE_26094 [Caenorhabditis remanei]|uniref:dolichyl-P-Man:Man5GlcNAc2-PP-dolichol alpha-1,3-mannosyltransferase n=1 Tax=Caenorhabditis remanei TaxID=31234 RepID=E3LRP4_CAERE|nr:hypothetical protein CRE_26094 [Caenorhabditis remanei]
MRELVSRILLGLFSANELGFNAVAAILMIIEACLSHIVILKVKYTEIDWSTYMQQVECYVNKGIMNYTEIGGDTGPIVYPAGHLFLYRILYFLTSSGRNIRLAQHLFQAFYLFNVFMVFRILQKTMRIPPIVLFLVTVTGYRIHSIFMLRLFNDPLAMMLFYVAMDRFLDRKWLVGCVFYSVAVSIKMNVLLFAPALFFTLILNNTFQHTLGYLAVCGLIQLYVGGIFLFHDWKSYIQRSFDLGRVFMFKWTVNWRFLPEELFLDKRFHIALLVGHITVLGLFAYYMWFRRLNGLPASLHIRVFQGIHTRTGPLETYYAFCTANLIGIAFSRSLHYQFYSWYFHQLPFLLFCDYPEVDSISKIPWKQFFWKVPLLLAIELCWNVYPSTWWSSALLHVCHIIIFWHLISTRPQLPMDFVSKHTKDTIRRNQEMMKETLEEYSNVVPSRDFEIYDSEEEAERAFAEQNIREKEREKTEELLQKTRKEPKEVKTRDQLDQEFERYYDEETKTLREDYKVYVRRDCSDDGEMQIADLLPNIDRSKLKIPERVQAIYMRALMIQEMVESDSQSGSECGSAVVSESESENQEVSTETDESDECTEVDDSENESLISEESEDENVSEISGMKSSSEGIKKKKKRNSGSSVEAEDDDEQEEEESKEENSGKGEEEGSKGREEVKEEEEETSEKQIKQELNHSSIPTGDFQKISENTNGIRRRVRFVSQEKLLV